MLIRWLAAVLLVLAPLGDRELRCAPEPALGGACPCETGVARGPVSPERCGCCDQPKERAPTPTVDRSGSVRVAAALFPQDMGAPRQQVEAAAGAVRAWGRAPALRPARVLHCRWLT